MKEGRERAIKGVRGQHSEGGELGRNGAAEQEMEGDFKGGLLRRTLASIQYAVHKTTHNSAIALNVGITNEKLCTGISAIFII